MTIQAIEIACDMREEDNMYVSDFSNLANVPSVFVTIEEQKGEGTVETQIELREDKVTQLHNWLEEWLEERDPQ